MAVGDDCARLVTDMFAYIYSRAPEQLRANECRIPINIARDLHDAVDQGPEGDQRYGASGSFPGSVVFVNAGPVPLQAMLSTCQSAKTALILVRLFCVPPIAGPPGMVVAWPLPAPTAVTVTLALPAKFVWLVVLAIP